MRTIFLACLAACCLTSVAFADKVQKFKCAHCGNMITIHKSKDLKAKCKVCMCGKTNAKCKPAKAKKH